MLANNALKRELRVALSRRGSGDRVQRQRGALANAELLVVDCERDRRERDRPLDLAMEDQSVDATLAALEPRRGGER